MEEIMGDHDVELDRQEDTVIGSPSSEGKMVIKLKIPKLAAAVEDGKSPEEDVIGILSSTRIMANEGKRVCPECKKEFSSGKALGGHMRIHVHKNPFLKPSKTTKFKRTAYDQGFNNGGDQDMKKEQQQQRKPYYMSSVNDEGKPTCSQCGKTFPSMKSLFGHMRCHPERIWRGILPPTTTTTRRAVKSNSYASSSSSLSGNRPSINEEGSKIDDDGGDQVVDLTKFLRGWSVTERRGRKALKPADEDDDEVLLEAVEDLMSLAQGGASMAESDVTQRQLKVDVFEGSNSTNSLTNKDHKIDENSPSINLRVMGYDIGKGKAVMEDEIERKSPGKFELDDGGVMIKNFSDNESESRNTNEELLINYKYKKNQLISPYKSPNKIKKRKKMKLMMELEQNTVVTGGLVTPPPVLPPLEQPAAIPECKYKCTTCNKCFTSHQALGGHRSSHNKLKITTSIDHHQIEADDYESFLMNHSGEITEKEVEFAGDAIGGPASGTANSNINNIHQCRICAKIFTTGQALGGHQRCHWTGTIEAQAPSSQITSTGEAASQTGSGRKVLDFDLNEIPLAMMEDEAGNGNGYASSSYNSNMV